MMNMRFKSGTAALAIVAASLVSIDLAQAQSSGSSGSSGGGGGVTPGDVGGPGAARDRAKSGGSTTTKSGTTGGSATTDAPMAPSPGASAADGKKGMKRGAKPMPASAAKGN